MIPSVAEDLGNPAWETAEACILILRLSPFKDIEASSSHLVLFSECRKALPTAFIDFGFFPGARDRAVLSAREVSYYYGLQSGRGPDDFDLVLVSNAFALELINLGYLYSGALLPRRASERAAAPADRRVPIVILGGSNASASGALLFPGAVPEESSDSLVDGIFFGEGEGEIGRLAAALTRAGASRAERLAGAAEIDGLWRALSGKAARRNILLPHPPALTEYPVLNSEGAATARLQISSGCPGFCSFCLEGWESRPYREIDRAELSKAARELKARTGASSLDVYSFNFNAHARIFDLMLDLNRVFRRVNFLSQRLDILAESPLLASAELAADKRSFTLGIEGISERMRRFYRKGLDARDIDAALDRLSLPAVRELKLFYILSGIEEDADFAEFADFAAATSERRRRMAPGQRVIASVGYLVRLPFTPLQYAALCLDRARLESLSRRIEGICAASGLECRRAADFEEYYADQLLALGGRAFAPWLERTPEEGLVYDGGPSRGTGASLEAFAARAGLLDEGFVGEKGEDWRPPLAFADENGPALRKSYLLASTFAPAKGRFPGPAAPETGWLRGFERLMAAKRAFASTLARVDVPSSLSRASSEYRASWLMRAISAASPEGGASVFDAEDALFAKGEVLEGMADRFWGLSYFRLRGPDSGRMERAAAAAGFAPVATLPVLKTIDALIEFPAALAGEAEKALKTWLARSRVSFVEERAGASRRLRPSARGAKKRILVEAELSGPAAGTGSGASAGTSSGAGPETAGTFSIRLSLGSKASIREWLSLMEPASARSASVRFLSFA